MRLIVLIMLSAGLWSCDGNSSNAEQGQPSASHASAKSGADLGTACEAVDTDEMAEIMGWNPEITVTEELINRRDGRLTVCHYLEEEGLLQVLLRISQESERAQANQGLEKLYKNVMTNGEKNITYEELPTILGTETIFGTGEGMHNYQTYILRSRYGNETDVTIEVSTDQSDEATLKAQIIAIAETLSK